MSAKSSFPHVSDLQYTAEWQEWNGTIYKASCFLIWMQGHSDVSSQLFRLQPFLRPLGSFWADVRGLSANRVGDIRPHRQGVEGIGFPWFPHLRPTEAREQREQCCLRAPVCFFSLSVSYSVSQLHLFFFYSFNCPHTLKHSWLHLFLCTLSVLTFSLIVHLFPSLSCQPDIITCRGSCNAPRASRITCCLPAYMSKHITIQHLSALLLDHR